MCKSALHTAAYCSGKAQRDVASVSSGHAHAALSPRSHGTQIIFGCEAAFSGREETLYNGVNITEHSSFQGRVRLSSRPKEASWSQYHFGSGLAFAECAELFTSYGY